MKSRNWVVAAGIFLFLATLTSGHGTWHMFALDKEEFCTVVLYQRYDLKYALGSEQIFPLTQKCDASYDMVPGFVNPAVIIFLGLAILCVGVSVSASIRGRRPASTRRTDPPGVWPREAPLGHGAPDRGQRCDGGQPRR